MVEILGIALIFVSGMIVGVLWERVDEYDCSEDYPDR